ncbi:ABC transporter ATP-binding protein [Thermodesulfobacteriota bacterium]
MGEVPKKKITLSGLRNSFKLYHFIRPYKVEYYIGMFFLFGSSLTSLAFPKLLGELVSAGNDGTLVDNLNRIALILALLLIVQSVFSYFRTVLFVNVTEKTLAYLRQHTYNHLIKLPLKFFDKKRVGELNSRISSDISRLQETLTSTLAEFIRQIIVIIGGIILLVYTSIELTLFMLAILPAVMIFAVSFGKFIRKYAKKSQDEVAKSNTIVEETLQGVQSVKSYTNEFFEILRYKNKTKEIAKIGIKGGRYMGALNSFVILGLFGALVAVIWKGSILLTNGDLDSGELFSFVLYSGFIGGTIGGLTNIFSRIQRFIGATEDLFEIFDEEEEDIFEIKNLDDKDILQGRIQFEHLYFSYPSRPDAEVLRDINLTINSNQMIALVGPSGAGKTTLATVLLRLHEPKKGCILFDDKDSRDIPLPILRKQIALVPQDIFLFGGTIQENIAYGDPSADSDRIVEAAGKANAWEFISRFPEGLETVVGERGTQLSGGQRQRIAIARAVLKDPKILILDEATSALDSESERLVQDALEKLMAGRTSIVIAHRLSTIRKADRIYVLEDGCLIENGTHDQLINQSGGMYKKLGDLQGL